MTAPHLWECIRATAQERGDREGIVFRGSGAEELSIPYQRFLERSAWLARQLPTLSLPDQPAPDQPASDQPASDQPLSGRENLPPVVLIAANDPLPTLLAFLAAVSRDAWPLILPAPKVLGGLDAFTEKLAEIVARFPGRITLALQAGVVPDGTALPAVPMMPLPATYADYGTAELLPAGGEAGGNDVAFLQMTSASTGDSRLVAISHSNALANFGAIRAALRHGPDERGGSWLPLYHDMGLVGMALYSFANGYPLIVMPSLTFIRKPAVWIRALSDFRCTFTAGPNFGYDYASRLVSDGDLAGVDLSALRVAVIGAEPIRYPTLRQFLDRFGPVGFRPGSFVPAYGLAESTLASTMTGPGTPPRYLTVDQVDLKPGRTVTIRGAGSVDIDSAPPDGPGVPVLSVGRPVRGLEYALLDDDGAPLTAEGVLGEIALRGTSISIGYVDPVAGRPIAFDGQVLRTGDLGFVSGGDLFILERKKHVIIRHGQNFLASLLEEQVARILQKPAQDLIVVDADIHNPDSDIIVVMENCRTGAPTRPEQAAALRDLDLPIDELHIARGRIIPRTTSGKKRYYQCRQDLATGGLIADSVLRLASR